MTNAKKEIKIMTEALIVRGGQVLLGRRKKKGFAQGKWLGFGGKVEAHETIDEAMQREFFEETGSRVLSFAERGKLIFHYINDPDMDVTYYEVLTHEDEPHETTEMEAQWFKVEDIPYDLMFPNDRYWLPMFLKKKYFKGEFWFNEDYQIAKYKIAEKV